MDHIFLGSRELGSVAMSVRRTIDALLRQILTVLIVGDLATDFWVVWIVNKGRNSI